MPKPTTNDVVVTGYVHNNYSGSYQTHSSGQFYDPTYDNAPGFFWFDNDRDGFLSTEDVTTGRVIGARFLVSIGTILLLPRPETVGTE